MMNVSSLKIIVRPAEDLSAPDQNGENPEEEQTAQEKNSDSEQPQNNHEDDPE